jgi:RNA polymerase sigma-70 factor (ECF subfamily)
MIEAEDPELVSRTLSGDRNAFGILVERYQNPVYTLALRMTGDRDEAEEVAQSAFVKAYEKLSSFDSGYKFFSWLYRIAHNEAVNVLERRQRHAVLEEGTESVELPSVRSDLNDIVNSCLLELSVDHRSVIVLKHFEGLSYEEVARTLGIPEKKVKSRLFSARTALRDVMTRKGIGSND